MRLKLWKFAHDKTEQLWHWIYYKRMLPLGYGGAWNPAQHREAGGYQYSVRYLTKSEAEDTQP